jgi:two-component system, NarL family, response regulator LiaR
MLKNIFIYGSILGLIMLLINSFEYFFLVRMNAIEIYIGLIALIFLSVGLWLGQPNKLTKEATIEMLPDYNSNSLGISKREFEVLLLLNKGFSNQKIADTLFVSNNTIKTHISNLFLKLEAKNRIQAILIAKNLGLIE